MQFTKTLMLLAALTSGSLANMNKRSTLIPVASPTSSSPSSASSSSSSSGGGSSGGSWTATPSSGSYSTEGFGSRTSSGGGGITYAGNTGDPWGSNMIQVSESDAANYKNVAQFKGENEESWNVVLFNKCGPDGEMTGWYGNSALTFELSAGDTKYVAFDDDSRGGWAAASGSIPTDNNGGYASTWGEFDFTSSSNGGWSGFDVSAITAQNAGLTVQGMSICDALGSTCSSITPDAASVDNAYTTAETDVGGVGGNLSGGGAVRLAVTIDYKG